jgi:hypothetical protein
MTETDKKNKILFINHKIKECSIYQYGKRIFNILKKSNNQEYFYIEIDNCEEYKLFLSNNNFNIIIYNYNNITLFWLTKYTINSNIKNIALIHNETIPDFFYFVININSIPRPIFENIENINYHYNSSKCHNNITNYENKNFIEKYTENEPNVPIFGSFGFGYKYKGFDKIIRYVNNQYNEAIIKLIIFDSYFNQDKPLLNKIINNCLNIKCKKGIKLMICCNFFTDEELLLFLKSNTMNLFLYDSIDNKCLSSCIDYAVSVKKPIGISISNKFKHIYSDDICLYKNNIEYCKKKSNGICETFLINNSNEKLIDNFDNIINKYIMKYIIL